jgi:magnesium transporter
VLGIFRGGLEIGIVVGLAMVLIVLVANFIGVVLPFLLTRIRVDPAVVSNPLITSVADVTGLIIYFSIATWILGSALH